MYSLDRTDRLLVDVDHGKRSAGNGLDGGKKKDDDGMKGREHGRIRVEA